MGGLELGLSELAALRPIRTAAGAGAADVGDAAAVGGTGTGCCVVAPLTMTDASGDGREFKEPRQDGGVVDDDVSGCVTPTARRDGGGEEDGVGVGVGSGIGISSAAGCVTPTARRVGDAEEDDGVGSAVGFVTPMARRDVGGEEEEEEDGAGFIFVTPMSAASALAQPTVCPPAPRKPGPVKRKQHCGSRGTPRRFFFSVPHDLDAVFVPSSPPLTPPASKKTRVHVAS